MHNMRIDSVSMITLYYKHHIFHEISKTHLPHKEPCLKYKHTKTIVSSICKAHKIKKGNYHAMSGQI